MTVVKLASKAGTAAAEAIGRHANALYASPGKAVVGVVELRHVERVQPAPDEDKEASVVLRVTQLELAAADQEDVLRHAMRALFLSRTAQGTLDEAGDIELAESTLEMTGDRLLDLDVARMSAACRHWADEARRAAISNLSAASARKQFEALAAGLLAAVGVKPE